ncbi:MAG TPA: hypothetical protein VF631_00715 [Allosphingosinicella sp.]|uniref:hypothetical protein n=1 Tax=Allosphingosinicella sp. TaxID=2823234 RepID=UPI002F296B6C
MDQEDRGKSKLIPGLAVAAVIVVGVVGLARGCSYASDEPNYENSANGTRNAPDA